MRAAVVRAGGAVCAAALSTVGSVGMGLRARHTLLEVLIVAGIARLEVCPVIYSHNHSARGSLQM